MPRGKFVDRLHDRPRPSHGTFERDGRQRSRRRRLHRLNGDRRRCAGLDPLARVDGGDEQETCGHDHRAAERETARHAANFS